jgi:hypothetical protein
MLAVATFLRTTVMQSACRLSSGVDHLRLSVDARNATVFSLTSPKVLMNIHYNLATTAFSSKFTAITGQIE